MTATGVPLKTREGQCVKSTSVAEAAQAPVAASAASAATVAAPAPAKAPAKKPVKVPAPGSVSAGVAGSSCRRVRSDGSHGPVCGPRWWRLAGSGPADLGPGPHRSRRHRRRCCRQAADGVAEVVRPARQQPI